MAMRKTDGWSGFNWVTGWTLLSTATLPLAWLLAGPFGALLLIFADGQRGSAGPGSSGLTMWGFVLGLGVTAATAQWLLMRRYLARAGWWVPLSLGGALATALALLALDLLAGLWLARPWAVLALLGAGAGVGQWLYLRGLLQRAGWWLVATFLGFGVYLLVPNPFHSLGELVVGLGAPYAVTGLALWALMRQGIQGGPQPAAQAAGGTAQVTKEQRGRRRMVLSLFFAALFVLAFVGPPLYARAQLALAKQDGIYPSPAEGLIRRAVAVEGAKLVWISELESGPAWGDGRLPHVWYAMARLTYDRPPTYWDRSSSSVGSYYLRVDGGWVHMPEGAFPNFVGRTMAIYHLER